MQIVTIFYSLTIEQNTIVAENIGIIHWGEIIVIYFISVERKDKKKNKTKYENSLFLKEH